MVQAGDDGTIGVGEPGGSMCAPLFVPLWQQVHTWESDDER